VPLGSLEIFYAVHTHGRDRLSLQWPHVSGTIVQSQSVYRPSARYTFYSADVDYVYRVDGRNYGGNRIKLWDPKLERENSILDSFVAAHPAGTTADVYYDPKQPERSVLIPGADESGNTFYTWNGTILTVLSILAVFRSRQFFARAIARAKAAEAARAAHAPR
jgi:hypothetical protein